MSSLRLALEQRAGPSVLRCHGMDPISALYLLVRGLILASQAQREVMTRIDEYAEKKNLTRRQVVNLLRAEAKRRGDAAVQNTLDRLAGMPDWAWMMPLGFTGLLVRRGLDIARRRRDDDRAE